MGVPNMGYPAFVSFFFFLFFHLSSFIFFFHLFLLILTTPSTATPRATPPCEAANCGPADANAAGRSEPATLPEFPDTYSIPATTRHCPGTNGAASTAAGWPRRVTRAQF